MSTVVVRRLDAPGALPTLPTADVERDVFGLVGAAGRPWSRTPGAAAVKRFWLARGTLVQPGDEVFVCEGQVELATTTDLRGAAAPIAATSTGALFVIDRDPLANWAHECTWVFVQADGVVLDAPAQWPPAGRRLLRVGRRVLD